MPIFGRKKAKALKMAAAAPVAIAKGTDGQIELYEQTVRIRRKHEEKDILLATISSVQLKRPSFLRAGYLEVSFAGGQESLSVLNDNSVLFNKKQRPAFERFKAELDRRILATRGSIPV